MNSQQPTKSDLYELAKRLPLSRSTVARNCPDMGAVGPEKREPCPPSTLGANLPRNRSRQKRLVVIVTLIACRNILCDDDNSGMGGSKALRDAVAKSLGIDDGDPRIRFQYGQQLTTGPEGTIVMIQRL